MGGVKRADSPHDFLCTKEKWAPNKNAGGFRVREKESEMGPSFSSSVPCGWSTNGQMRIIPSPIQFGRSAQGPASFDSSNTKYNKTLEQVANAREADRLDYESMESRIFND